MTAASPDGGGLLVLFALGMVAGAWAHQHFARRRKRTRSGSTTTKERARTPRPALNSLRVSPGRNLTWLRTAVYLYFDRVGTLLYVGIARDASERARQHAGLGREAMKPWWPEVDPSRTQAWWMPNRVAACCVEWALIRYLRPAWNTAPGSSDDAYCVDQKPIEAVIVEFPSWEAVAAKRAERMVRRAG